MGMTFAVLHMLGKQPAEKDLFMSSERGIEILSLIKWRIFVGILFGPTHLLLFKDFVMFLISSGVVGDIKKGFRVRMFKIIKVVPSRRRDVALKLCPNRGKKIVKAFCHIFGVFNGFSVY